MPEHSLPDDAAGSEADASTDAARAGDSSTGGTADSAAASSQSLGESSGQLPGQLPGQPFGRAVAHAGDAELATRDPVPRGRVRRRRSGKPGPGLVESVVWTVGVFVVHQLAIAATILGLAVGILLMNGQFSRQDVITAESPMMGVAVCGELLGFTVCAVGAAILRLNWNRLAERLPMRRLSAGHLAILIALVFPMSVISDGFYQLSDTYLWQPFVQSHPELESFDAQNTMELIPKIAEQLPLPMLLIALALAPAIGEELVFRGVIGRGLTARWGLIGGVLLTSVLFAAIHIHPAHAIGVLPLGICMHLLYLATRNFLAPVLFHLLNNTLAVIAVESIELPGGIGTTDLPAWSVVAVAVPCAILFFVLLWSTRTRFRFATGAEWSPGFATADCPPPFLDVQRVHDSGPSWLWGAAGLSLLVFFASAML